MTATGQIESSPVSIHVGDITSFNVDAIVVPQFERSVSYGGVGGAVARSGASMGMEDFGKIITAKGPLPFGSVHLTKSWGGKADYLLHAVSVDSGAEFEFDTVKSCMFNAMSVAQANGIKTIATPALGTGIIGELTDEQSAQSLMSAIAEYNRASPNNGLSVAFVIFGSQKSADIFGQVLATKSYLSADDEQVGRREFDAVRWIVGMQLDFNANHAKFGS